MVLVLFLVVLIFISAIFSASEVALFSLGNTHSNFFAKKDSFAKRSIVFLLKNPRDLLVTILLVNITVNILVQSLFASFFGDLFSFWMKIFIPLLLTLLFGEFFPKSIALHNNRSIAMAFSPIIAFVRFLFTPIIWFVSFVSSYFSCFLPEGNYIPLEDLIGALKVSNVSDISKVEMDIIGGIVKMKNTSVKEIMNKKKDIICYDINQPIAKMKDLFVGGVTHIFVVDGVLEHFVGILVHKVFLCGEHLLYQDFKGLLKQPYFVPDTLRLNKLWDIFGKLIDDYVVVVDEYGQIVGSITREMLVRFVAGGTNRKELSVQNENAVIALGSSELFHLEDFFNVQFKRSASTVNGLLTEILGDMPKVGKEYKEEGLSFCVLSVKNTCVNNVYVRRLC